MLENIIGIVRRWHQGTSERQKLQHIYLALVVLVIFIAGVTTFFNADLGHKIVWIAIFAAGAFLANAIVWNLLNSALLLKLNSRPRRKQ